MTLVIPFLDDAFWPLVELYLPLDGDPLAERWGIWILRRP